MNKLDRGLDALGSIADQMVNLKKEKEKLYLLTNSLLDENVQLKKVNHKAIKTLKIFCSKVCDAPARVKKPCGNNRCLINEALERLMEGEGE